MRHGAGVIVIREDGAALLQHRDDKPEVVNPGLWSYPAGAVQENKDYEDAARRELQEETGYVADKIFLVVEGEFTRTDGQRITRHIYWTSFDQAQTVTCREGAELRFVRLEEIPPDRFTPGHRAIIQQAIDLARSSSR